MGASETFVSSSSLRLVRAQRDDLGTVLEILEEARQWLVGQGISEQWPAPMPPGIFAERIAHGDVYLARAGPEHGTVGTLCLLRSDARVWGDMPADAGYIHGLAVRRSLAGRNLGAAVLGLASQLAAEMGLGYLRLDCWAGNRADTLVRYLHRASEGGYFVSYYPFFLVAGRVT